MSPSRPRIAAATAFLAASAVVVASVLMVPANAGTGHSKVTQTKARSAGATSHRAAGTEVLLQMNGKRTKKKPSGVTGLRNSGRSKVNVDVIARDGGKAKLVRGRGNKHAIRLPALSMERRPPKAEIRVLTATRKGSPLNPGRNNFTFGADFVLDRVSDGGPRDDGDNLMQHGQFDNGPQYKIQLDKSKPMCRVKGNQGAVQVTGDRLGRARWFRIRCQRTDDTLRQRVWKILKNGDLQLVSDLTNTGPIGAVRLPRSRALSIGGRLNAKNRLPKGHTDQFNGIVDNVLYNIL